MKLCVINIRVLSLFLIFARLSATILNASISSQESISSRIIYFGFSNLICSSSIFLFSQPLNHT